MGIGAAATGLPLVYVAAVLWGVANGVFIAVDWALMTEIIPRASSGRYMGLSNVATGTSGLAAILAGGVLADVVNRELGMGTGMRASLLLGLVLFLLAAWALRPVVEPKRRRAGPAAAPA
jgi:MFS family permease